MTIQTCGSCDSNDELYSISIAFESHAVTIDGLSKDDLEELQSCISCLLSTDE